MPDDVQLTDLEVIQRFSLAVRGSTAPRADVIAALESDLAWLRGAADEIDPTAAFAAKPARKDLAKRATARRTGA